MSLKSQGSVDPVEAAVARIYGPGQAPGSTRGAPAGQAFILPPLMLDAADLANLHQLAEMNFLAAKRTVDEAHGALKAAGERQAAAWRMLCWLEGELVAHTEKHGLPVTAKLHTIEQDREAGT